MCVARQQRALSCLGSESAASSNLRGDGEAAVSLSYVGSEAAASFKLLGQRVSSKLKLGWGRRGSSELKVAWRE